MKAKSFRLGHFAGVPHSSAMRRTWRKLQGTVMIKSFLVIALALGLGVASADAQERTRLGYGRLLTNDALGDNLDRWRTGSVASSRVWGPAWTGSLPNRFGELIELRLGAEVISPAALVLPDPRDRRYAGTLSAGLHTHFNHAGTDIAAGLNLAVVGPVTQLDELQGAFHDLLNISQPSALVTDAQIGNKIRPDLILEAARDVALGDSVSLRPFVEARAGLETMARVGVDLTFGARGQGELLVRDPVSGHHYQVIRQDWSGLSFVLGADIAYVADSVYLPETGGLTLEDTRERVRLGMHWQGKSGAGVFYGLTYLSEEFEAQPEGQLIGSIRVNWQF